MLKELRLKHHSLHIEWQPETVGRYLDEHKIPVDDLLQPDKLQTRTLCRELFLLAARASLNENEKVRGYAVLLRHFARSLSTLAQQQPVCKRRKPMNHSVNTHTTEQPSLDGLQAQLFRLLTQYSLHPCRHIATHIVQALTHLCQHPHIELVPEQRHIYSQSLNVWRSRLLQTQPAMSQQLH
ncbi:MAG: hypothetical protein RIB78_09430 [Gammaproteobacteria bacterium]